LAVVVEYDVGGRLGSDAVNLHCAAYNGTIIAAQGVVSSQYIAAWATVNLQPNVVLEFSDGTFGTLYGAFPYSAFNTHPYAANTAVADEYAIPFSVPFPCQVDGLWAVVAPTGDFELLLYDGTTALATISVDANAIRTSGSSFLEFPIASVSLLANHTYYVALRPTTTTSITAYSHDVADANHLSVHSGGITATYVTRLNQGAWASPTATRRLWAGVMISALDDGVGGGSGGGFPILGGSVVR
jgi:hypothetical protein